jgi:hypothetical protein
MPTSDYPNIEAALSGFTWARLLVKSAAGFLATHPNGLTATNLVSIATGLGDFLIHFIREDFARRLKVAEAAVGSH